MRQDFNSLGDRLKKLERKNQDYLSPFSPVYARLDGKAFSKFTKGMVKPFDEKMNNMMVDVATILLEETNASIAYHQSDEISIYWKDMHDWYSGRVDKILGELVGLSTATINQLTALNFPAKLCHFPRFDCRIFNVDETTATEFFMWRQMDSIRNSISLCAQQHFSHRKLQHVNSKMKKEWLRDIGEPWEQLEDRYKYGTFIRKEKRLMAIDKSIIKPEHHHKVPDEAVRNVTKALVYSPLQDFDDLHELMTFDTCEKYIIQ